MRICKSNSRVDTETHSDSRKQKGCSAHQKQCCLSYRRDCVHHKLGKSQINLQADKRELHTSCDVAFTEDELLGNSASHAYIQLCQQLPSGHTGLVVLIRQLHNHTQCHSCNATLHHVTPLHQGCSRALWTRIQQLGQQSTVAMHSAFYNNNLTHPDDAMLLLGCHGTCSDVHCPHCHYW